MEREVTMRNLLHAVKIEMEGWGNMHSVCFTLLFTYLAIVYIWFLCIATIIPLCTYIYFMEIFCAC